MPDATFLDEFYDAYPRIEAAFQEALDVSLSPRGPSILYDIVGALALPQGAGAIDGGCGEGEHSIALANRFGLRVLGVDPVPRHIDLAREALAEAARHDASLTDRVRFELGTLDALPAAGASVELVWCKEVFEHIEAPDRAFAECRRVLRPGGHVLLRQMFATDRLEPREAEWLWRTMGVVPANADPTHIEAAFEAAGLHAKECIVLAGEWGEFGQETRGSGGRRLAHASRLLREPERYIAVFGQAAYDTMLGDCLWHIYGMIGKLCPRVYLLQPSRA